MCRYSEGARLPCDCVNWQAWWLIYVIQLVIVLTPSAVNSSPVVNTRLHCLSDNKSSLPLRHCVTAWSSNRRWSTRSTPQNRVIIIIIIMTIIISLNVITPRLLLLLLLIKTRLLTQRSPLSQTGNIASSLTNCTSKQLVHVPVMIGRGL